jgi:hypothetical protein
MDCPVRGTRPSGAVFLCPTSQWTRDESISTVLVTSDDSAHPELGVPGELVADNVSAVDALQQQMCSSRGDG